MSSTVFLRPLVLEDANVSCHWRNNPEIWKFTGFVPDVPITNDIERKWITEVLKKTDQRRFAICLIENQKYIGNVQLLKITKKSAEFHLFIGEPEYWGKGIGKEATGLMMDFAFLELGLENVILQVDKENFAAIAIYKKHGFVEVEVENHRNVMRVTKENYLNNHSNYLV